MSNFILESLISIGQDYDVKKHNTSKLPKSGCLEFILFLDLSFKNHNFLYEYPNDAFLDSF